MKHLIIILLSAITLIGCKKEITEEKNHFLRGRLLTECNGTPIANQELQLWRDLIPSSLLVSEKPAVLLETTTTNSDGYFYFIGNDDYVKKNTKALHGASIRTSSSIQSKITIGILGENSKYKSKNSDTEYSNKNIGDIYLNGMNSNIELKIAVQDAFVTYDSVKVVPISFLYPTTIMLTSSNANYFSTILNNVKLNPKHLSYPDYYIGDHNKFKFQMQLFFYSNGSSSSAYSKSVYINECATSSLVQFDF